jgi:UDP:flavonoid glycosyltransferase YjiC (YdhE family)
MAEAGHDVAFGTPSFLRDAVESAGFRWVRAGVENDDPEMVSIQERCRDLLGADFLRVMQVDVFAGVRPRRLVPDLLALSRTQRPDLIVHDSQEFGGMIVAELLQIPHVKVLVNAAGVTRPEVVAMREEPLQYLRAAYGLPNRPITELVDHFLAITPFPVSLNRPDAPISPTAHHLRLLPGDPARSALPAWVDTVGLRPLIYVSLGTLFSGPHGLEVFSGPLAGLRDVGAEIVVTVGNELDPAALGPQPKNVHIRS